MQGSGVHNVQYRSVDKVQQKITSLSRPKFLREHTYSPPTSTDRPSTKLAPVGISLYPSTASPSTDLPLSPRSATLPL